MRAAKSPWAGNGGPRPGAGAKPRDGVARSEVLRYQATPEQRTKILAAVERDGRTHNTVALEVMLAWAAGYLTVERPGAPAAEAPERIRLDFANSSNLLDAELEVAARVLTVRFRGDPPRTYRYHGVTPEVMEAWRTAPSAGSWFAQMIRGKFPVVQHGGDPRDPTPPSVPEGVGASVASRVKFRDA